jgi:hypothetical protein
MMAPKHHTLTVRLDPSLVRDVKRIARARSYSEDRDVSLNQLVHESLARLVRQEGQGTLPPAYEQGAPA